MRGLIMQHKPYGPYEKFIKRPLDMILSTLALIVLSPILLITAVLVRVKLGSPVLFTQERPGKNEKIFKLYKFRTMTDKRDENGKLLPDTDRLTPFGKKLRATSLDELPELFNIAKGDMAIIGPRPLLVSYLPYYRGKEKLRHSVRPGLSGLAQVSGRNFIEWDKRLAKDVEYVEKITFLGDLKIVMMTIRQVLVHDNVAVDTTSEGNLAEIRSKQ
jgi:lipopolysaccharide/colanic/teichoic acid biosynthesis glycosyltransferase